MLDWTDSMAQLAVEEQRESERKKKGREREKRMNGRRRIAEGGTDLQLLKPPSCLLLQTVLEEWKREGRIEEERTESVTAGGRQRRGRSPALSLVC